MSWLNGDERIVPMVMFHSVGLEDIDWEYRHISEPVAAFEEKIAWLSAAGFNFITWGQLYDYIRGEGQITLPAIVLTFDDGYLDNWVYAYPILRKYGAKGTIFVSSEFVDPSAGCRFNMDDVDAGRCDRASLPVAGFLNWDEMRAMEREGVMDIQSHAKTHTWYFTAPTVVDFWKPEQRIHCWMAWNERPDRKPFYLTEDQWSYVELGTPVYAHEKALCARRFYPAEEIAYGMNKFVSENGGSRIFDLPDALVRLRQHHKDLHAQWAEGCRYESSDERRERVYGELYDSKREIELNLAKSVDFICWPGGGYDDLTLTIAKEVGFKSWTLGSGDQRAVRNVPGGDPQQIKRIGSAAKQSWRGKDLGWTTGREFLYGVRRHQGSATHKWMIRGLKLLRVAGVRL